LVGLALDDPMARQFRHESGVAVDQALCHLLVSSHLGEHLAEGGEVGQW
jgi:hypothetical protein